MTKSTYLEGDNERDIATARAVRTVTREAIDSLLRSQMDTGEWPYELASDAAPVPPTNFSTSTQTMILHSLAISTGLLRHSALVPALESAPFEILAERAQPALQAGLTKLVAELTQRDAANPGSQDLTASSTWGSNDPLTLTWLHELLKHSSSLTTATPPGQVRNILERIEAAATTALERALNRDPGTLLNVPTDSSRKTPHAFIVLRIMQLASSVGLDVTSRSNGRLEKFFENAIHAELARNSIRDGGFDPASLVFALEGLVELAPATVPQALVDRVVEVLGTAHEIAAHWRPVHPITATSQGLVLLPQSIEVANSFLRIAGAWEDIRGRSLFADSLPSLREYADWVSSTAIQLTTSPGMLAYGWQSEHTFEAGTIHLWATSQVVLFLEHFGAMLERHIARESREAASLDFRGIAERRSEPERQILWDQQRSHEPLLALPSGHDYRVYDRTDELFVEPRIGESKEAYFSMLLYGPPGTGKTKFAKSLADRLDYDYISLSPSDFTRSGESGVEARAQRLFSVLETQTRCVILFDEIDRLLLDRDSPEYEKQGDIFQFMTPSMLTKINDLRQSESCIFIIATNYADRIDSAIKRPGRIDAQLLLVPPDLAQRREIVREISSRIDCPLDDTKIASLAHATPLFVFTELKELVEEIKRKGAPTGAEEFASLLKDLLTERNPTISIESYKSRLMRESEPRLDVEKTPWLEFAILVYLAHETGTFTAHDWVRKVLKLSLPRIQEPFRAALEPIANG